ncbi:hypothetical protein CPB83DRAFT_856412 [Crepidotus variabilis]|uniref:Uncharacterized protein n=1 Tax=Crepidotus variabilis TaxID=179855 RepID=A0A9P6JNP6_9AGAR|nr:hypothetical protein CPB83DRAFT_856412 [Crepidotus variabilis]
MIIRLEANGQPCLDDDGSSFEEKASLLDIALPEQSYHPEQPINPVLRNIDTGYATSISTDSDTQSIAATSQTIHPTITSSSTRRRLPLFTRPFSRPRYTGPILGELSIEDSPSSKAKRTKLLALSWSELSKSRKLVATWFILTLALCVLVALVVWSAVRQSIRRVLFQNMSSEWSLESMNIYNQPVEMFGCPNQPNQRGSNFLFFVPYGKQAAHTFAIEGGGAVGQVTLTSSPDPTAEEIAYDIVVTGSASGISFNTPPAGQVTDSSTTFIVATPATPMSMSPPPPFASGMPPPPPHSFTPPPPGFSPMPSPPLGSPMPLPPLGSQSQPMPCLRYDVTMYIPRTLKTLSLNISTPTQITFSPQGHIELDSLIINLSSLHPRTRIEASESLHATNMELSINGGIVHGSLSIGDSSTVTSIFGQIMLNVIPDSSTPDLTHPGTAKLNTTTQRGQVTVMYLRNQAYRKRKIESYHNFRTPIGFGRFDYSSSSFAGQLYSNTSHYNVSNAAFEGLTPTKLDGQDGWTTAWGNKTGDDRIYITSGMGQVLLP